ncbi:MAG: glycosyltransferase family 2 protein [Lachnospiraceae bacterium]|jgi:cellulose synthase/poly-beta-1,6-N-acetylglucosamine synthase-like glycosyltransferase|nr:glycosyltransferase family 2 protein [Lachnospiraceae bacterium]MBR4412021.1 glycosyltransferase family 2 protein [Lachnospiraceae bacterium]MBR5066566.1 glycosyltransferase family 2 protein [Lachnospiraceae bacterium]MBR5918024.1 glycosyltransferase family 2 protein [Lachnospiraceae bacterium]SDJ41533.1 Glycosyltransferase, catalytic subunit of cellulose synthase and poly-beta-1,6-N-acetylglucosamine synthase [Lachnospiraceae bacterium G41]
MAIATEVFFILACIVNAVYFIWVSILWAFPKVLHTGKDYVPNDEAFEECNIFLIIPCMNEENVCEATIRNLLGHNIPNLRILAIDDASSDRTLEILKSIKDERLLIVERKKPNAQQGKGRALNHAYRYIVDYTKENNLNPARVYVGVFDADTYVQKSLLQKVATIMNDEPNCAMLQARVRIGTSTRDSILPLMQDIEFFSCINMMQNVREYTGTVGAAGNGQFSRLTAMMDLGDEPWSDCLLEDFDFSLRLLLRGWRTRLIQDERVYQQGVTNYRKFVKQRTRWAQGGLQSMKYLFQIARSRYLSLSGKIELIYFLFIPFVSFISLAVLLFCWFLTMFMSSPEGMINILYGLSWYENAILAIIILVLVYAPGFVFCFRYKKDTEIGLLNTILASFFMPIYNLMQIPASVTAVLRQLVGRKGWVKTEHKEVETE